MEIANIRPDGLVDKWNAQHPEVTIKKGDVIVSTNGVVVCEEMRKELRKKQVTQVRIRRGEQEPAQAEDDWAAALAQEEEVQGQVDETAAALSAVGAGNILELKSIMGRGTHPDTIVDSQGRAALVVAAERANSKVLSLLLKHGASVDKTDQEGQSALFWVIFGETPLEDKLQCVRILAKEGANVNLEIDGCTPLLLAQDLDPTNRLADLLVKLGATEGSDVAPSDEPANSDN